MGVYQPQRKDDRVIIHFDYDCFYAACFEVVNPVLKQLPLAVQQKQIIVTCNYEARRRGLHKLQLIRDAKRVCPEVIIELGEDISRFRDVSKDLYRYIKSFSWNGKVERLGFDEIWLDVTDMVEYNMTLLNRIDLESSFFQLSKDDPTRGFAFDATVQAGHVFPKDHTSATTAAADHIDALTMRLRLGGHLALHLRRQLEHIKGFTATVGISTSKVLSKLVGNLNKPTAQTTLMPSPNPDSHGLDNVATFMDSHEIGKVPGIGFKMAQKLREHVLNRPAAFDDGLVYGGTRECVTVADLRKHPGLDSDTLEQLLAGPGAPHGIGDKIWRLLHGVDDSEVTLARAVPHQISIEDSYIRLDTMPELLSQLTSLARSLLTRMRIDLLGNADDEDAPEADHGTKHAEKPPPHDGSIPSRRWLAHPRTLRLTTRPRQPLQPDGTRVRSFKRISHSAPLPNFVFGLQDHVDVLAERLVKEALVPMFRRLHPEKAGWNLSLVNLAVTNMAEAGGESRTARGRDISDMFRRQDDVLKDFRVVDVASPPPPLGVRDDLETDEIQETMAKHDDAPEWDDDVADDDLADSCPLCGMAMPLFARAAHLRYHSQNQT